MSLNEILLIGLMQLAKHLQDANKYFYLFNMLSRRFDTAAKVMILASQALGKFHRRPYALRGNEWDKQSAEGRNLQKKLDSKAEEWRKTALKLFR